MSMPSLPQPFRHKIDSGSKIDVDSNIDGALDSNISGALNAIHSGSLHTDIGGHLDLKTDNDIKSDNVLTLKGDSKAPVFTDSKIEILNLPRFTLQDIKDMMKQRVRIPNYSNSCFKVMGVEVFSFCMSGESQIITEPYIPNAAERCEDDCCEVDTRPFPNQKTEDGKPN
jgi:hypothetical protein